MTIRSTPRLFSAAPGRHFNAAIALVAHDDIAGQHERLFLFFKGPSLMREVRIPSAQNAISGKIRANLLP